MSFFIKNGFLQNQSSLLVLKRFRGKINIQRPKQPHYERARFLAVTEPEYPKTETRLSCVNENLKKLQSVTENPYEKILAKDILNWFNHSQTVTFFHLNSITSDELFKCRVELHKQNMHLKMYGKKLIRMAVENSKYVNVIPLFESKTCIVFSNDQKVQQIIKITKKVPQMILLGGIVEDRLLSRNEYINYANMPSLSVVQAQFVNVLNTIGGNLVNNLEAHQKQLVSILDVHVRNQQDNN